MAMADIRKILHNKIKCKLCGDVIESKHVHNFVRCSCGNAFVDGGTEYVRYGAKDMNTIEDMIEYEE